MSTITIKTTELGRVVLTGQRYYAYETGPGSKRYSIMDSIELNDDRLPRKLFEMISMSAILNLLGRN